MDENIWLGPRLEPRPPNLETGTIPLSYILPTESSIIAYFVGGETRGFIPHTLFISDLFLFLLNWELYCFTNNSHISFAS